MGPTITRTFALKGQHKQSCLLGGPLQGEKIIVNTLPRALPWATMFQAFRPFNDFVSCSQFQPRRNNPENGQRDDCRRASAISSARRAASSSARSSSYDENRLFGSGAIIRCKTRAVGRDTFGAIARNSDGCCFNSYNSVAELVPLSIGVFPATA